MSRTNTAMVQRPVNSNPFAEPDVLTPYQFFKVFRQKGHMDPEEKLMFAVLTDAVECFQKHIDANSRRCRALFNEADAWIASRDSGWPFSFEQICSMLDISPSYLRLGLARWRVTRECDRGRRRRLREPLRYQYRMKNKHLTV